MLDKIRSLFSKQKALQFVPTDIGWCAERPSGLEGENAFDWAAEQTDEYRGLAYFLAQLVSEDLATIEDSGLIIPWDNIFLVSGNSEYNGLISGLQLPEETPVVRPILDCLNTLSDPDFALNISGWRINKNLLKNGNRIGACIVWEGKSFLMSQSSWRLANEIESFNDRPPEMRTNSENELAWGTIRTLATRAKCFYNSRYLETTVIITPELLKLKLDKLIVSGETVTTVSPTFSGAPDDWLSRLDFHSKIQGSYSFSSDLGVCKVILSEPVKHVLSVIKRDMPNRKVVGRTAEAFLRNPYALLGDDAFQVIDEAEFDQERERIGAFESGWNFKAVLSGCLIEQVNVEIETESGVVIESILQPNDLREFLKQLQSSIANSQESHHWGSYHLRIDGNTPNELEQGERIFSIWESTENHVIDTQQIYDLSEYSDRVIGIGEVRPVSLPILLKNEDGSSWSPELEPAIMVRLPDAEMPLLIPATPEFRNDLGSNIIQAKSDSQDQVELPRLHFAVPISQAEHALKVIKTFLAGEPSNSSEPEPPAEKPIKPPTLIISTNFDQDDYIKQRAEWLETPDSYTVRVPKSLRLNVSLKTHQNAGVRRLQHLESVGDGCFGALLADDMGLGKTLQLLCLIGDFYHRKPKADPSVIVAPVTLLDNWEQEVSKFFDSSFPKLLRLHGNNLKALKQPKELIESQLLEDGITNLLKPGWLGDAKLVITTYETLRDHEFSLARQNFEIFICDEAQKIKNPSARATLAIKKQKARFRIACTGTPVENNLVDLWSLFDWIQPGLLGSVQEFHQKYRRPIESETADELESINRLKALINPQTLRRTKEDISDDLPRKIEIIGERQEIEMSQYQHDYYQDCITRLGAAQSDSSATKRTKDTWSLLHRIKAICAEPYCLPGTLFSPDNPISRHISNSPKIKWLLNELANIKNRDEKVIIFTELRQVQQSLHYFIKNSFGLSTKIINGTTKNRQHHIDQFQQVKGFNTIILSPLAAGAGLNIVAANHVIHFTRMWNPAKEAQATDRAYRIGQTKDVYVHCPTIVSAKGNELVTFEEKLNQLMLAKKKLANDMLNGSGGDFGPGALVGSSTTNSNNTDHVLPEDLDFLDGVGFECFCVLFFQQDGWASVTKTKRSGDGGVDLITQRGSTGLLIQCKSSQQKNSRLGWEAVKDVVGGTAMYKKQYPNVTFKKVAITNQYFNESAIDQAMANNVQIIDKSVITNKLKVFPILRSKLDELLIQAI